MDIRVIDFETTDLPENGGLIIETGWTDLKVEKTHMGLTTLMWKDSSPNSIRHGIPLGTVIAPAAKAQHHIQESMLTTWDPYTITDALLLLSAERGTSRQFDILVAHNCEFERAMLKKYLNGSPTPPFICTMKVARRVWPSAESFSLQYLRYHTNLERGWTDRRCDPPHAAGPDTWLTSMLLVEMHENHHVSLQQMIAWTEQPAFYLTCPIGKWKGKEWHKIDTGYLNWMAYKAEDMDADIRAAALNELALRKG